MVVIVEKQNVLNVIANVSSKIKSVPTSVNVKSVRMDETIVSNDT